jgi:hypothetical protein
MALVETLVKDAAGRMQVVARQAITGQGESRFMTSIFRGAVLCYAVQTEKYLQTPIAFLFPGLFVGYHSMSAIRRIGVGNLLRDFKEEVRKFNSPVTAAHANETKPSNVE